MAECMQRGESGSLIDKIKNANDVTLLIVPREGTSYFIVIMYVGSTAVAVFPIDDLDAFFAELKRAFPPGDPKTPHFAMGLVPCGVDCPDQDTQLSLFMSMANRGLRVLNNALSDVFTRARAATSLRQTQLPPMPAELKAAIVGFEKALKEYVAKVPRPRGP